MAIDVAIAPCSSYAHADCRRALCEVFAPFGGFDWVRQGMRVAVKANLVSFLKPEAAATTHPALLCALSELLSERGASVTIGDSPGGIFNAAYVGRVYSATGMHDAESYGAALNQDFSQRDAVYPDGAVCRSFPYTAWLDRADVVINFCKLKTHGMMALSCAVKNIFGVIPGTKKPEFHFQYSNPANFARMLVDLNEFRRAEFSVCDAVVGMEGNGPTSGTPREIGCILAAENPHKLDLLAAALIGLSRQDVPTLEAAFERKLIPEAAAALSVSTAWESYCLADFQRIEAQSSLLFRGNNSFWGRIRGRLIQSALSPRPAVQQSACIGCGKCEEICPAKAIQIKNKLPTITYANCIHCFCCQEFCPKGAIAQHRPVIARLLNK